MPVTGVKPGEYEKHSLGIGGATHLLQRLVEWDQCSMADRVEVWSRGSKGDHLPKGAILTRARKGLPKPVGARGGAAE